MKYVKCVKCGQDNEIDITKAIDEEGEVFACEHCNYPVRYALS